MDEPLSNLDAKLRVQMRAEIASLQKQMGTTTVYVTHDQVEAMTMGHRVAVLRLGELQQVAAPQDLYDNPDNVFVAGFIGTPPMTLFHAGLTVEGDSARLQVGPQEIALPREVLDQRPSLRERNQHEVIAGVRAEDIHCGVARRPGRPAGDRGPRGGPRARRCMSRSRSRARPSTRPGWAAAWRRRPRRRWSGSAMQPTSRARRSSRPGSASPRTTRSPSTSTRSGCTSSTWTPGLRFGRWAIAALAAAGLAVGTAVGSASADSGFEALAAPSVRSAIASDTFYFVMTDRYRDGQPANNDGGRTGPVETTGFDPTSDAYYHGGDLAGLTGRCDPADPSDDGLARIKRLGFTAVWITPPFVQRTVQGTQRRVPRLLVPRHHPARSARGHRGRVRLVHGVREEARPQGLPRRRRQPHGRRHHVPGGHGLRADRQGPVPHCSGAGVQPVVLHRRHGVPATVGNAQLREDAHRPGAAPRGQGPGGPQRGDALPQSRRHLLGQLRGPVRDGRRLLRTRRPHDRGLDRRAGARRGVRRLDHEVRRRRVPARHRQARRSLLLRTVAAARAAGGDRGRQAGVHQLRRDLVHGRCAALGDDARPAAAVRPRLPVPGRGAVRT